MMKVYLLDRRYWYFQGGNSSATKEGAVVPLGGRQRVGERRGKGKASEASEGREAGGKGKGRGATGEELSI